MEDHMAAMTARVAHMKVLGVNLPMSAIWVFKILWPDTEPPKRIEELCAWLDSTDVRLDEWRESAGRARADMALQFILSWYEEIDFDALTSIRVGSKVLEDPEVKKKCQARAYHMAQYASVHTFIPDPEAPQEFEDEEVHDGESNEDDIVDEEIDADMPPSKKPKTAELEKNAGSSSAEIPSTET
jgi:hypothetical protein